MVAYVGATFEARYTPIFAHFDFKCGENPEKPENPEILGFRIFLELKTAAFADNHRYHPFPMGSVDIPPLIRQSHEFSTVFASFSMIFRAIYPCRRNFWTRLYIYIRECIR